MRRIYPTVNPNIYGRDLSNDIILNNNIPHGVWDDGDASILYPELQEYDDYNTYPSLCMYFIIRYLFVYT